MITSWRAERHAWRHSLKQFRRELSEVVPPDRPAMVACRQVPFVVDFLFLERRDELFVPLEQEVVLAAANPEQFQFLVRALGVVQRTGDCVVGRYRGTES